MGNTLKTLAVGAMLCLCTLASAQKYKGVVDKTVAVVGGEMISLSDIEAEVQLMRSQGYSSDRNMRCELLENILQNKLFLMQRGLTRLPSRKTCPGMSSRRKPIVTGRFTSIFVAVL